MNKIKKVEIHHLWNDPNQNFQWILNEDVNVLSGINGIGKSTIMNTISALMNGKADSLKDTVNEVQIFINDHDFFHYKRFNKTFSEIKKSVKLREKIENTELSYEKLYNEIKSVETDEIKSLSFDIVKNSLSLDRFKKETIIDIISTFDNTIVFDEETYDEDVETELDKELYLLQKKYLDYQLNLAKKVQASYGSNQKKIKSTFKEIYNDLDEFKKQINLFFTPSGKILNESLNELSFYIVQADKPISIYQLSSGEKQLVLILLTVLLQEKKDSIIFMDEPEISLHFDWQKKIIEVITLLNPKAQLIIATHSPAMVMDGWLDKVINVDDIRKWPQD